MPKCDVCGKEFDSKRGLNVHKAKSHEGDKESNAAKRNCSLKKVCNTKNFFRFATVFLLLVLIMVAFEVYFPGPDKEEVVESSMEYIHENLKGGRNVTLLSSHETNSSLYRLDVNVEGQGNFEFYVTEDGEYLFLERPTKMD